MEWEKTRSKETKKVIVEVQRVREQVMVMAMGMRWRREMEERLSRANPVTTICRVSEWEVSLSGWDENQFVFKHVV